MLSIALSGIAATLNASIIIYNKSISHLRTRTVSRIPLLVPTREHIDSIRIECRAEFSCSSIVDVLSPASVDNAVEYISLDALSRSAPEKPGVQQQVDN